MNEKQVNFLFIVFTPIMFMLITLPLTSKYGFKALVLENALMTGLILAYIGKVNKCV